MPRFAIVILAAGGSTRLGRPKALVPYESATLIEHAAATALCSTANEILIVLGDAEALIRPVVARLPVCIISNPDWKEGIASSIRTGIGILRPNVEGALIVLADQPKITAQHLNALASRGAGGSIVASAYDGILGVPAYFPRSAFGDLLALQGDTGARRVIQAHGALAVDCPEGAADVDVEADVLNLEQQPIEIRATQRAKSE